MDLLLKSLFQPDERITLRPVLGKNSVVPAALSVDIAAFAAFAHHVLIGLQKFGKLPCLM